MNRTEKLIDTIARLNPDAGEIGAGMLANIVAEAKAIQLEKPAVAVQAEPGEIVYRWMALDYSGYCYGSNPPDNLPARCNLKAFHELA